MLQNHQVVRSNSIDVYATLTTSITNDPPSVSRVSVSAVAEIACASCSRGFAILVAHRYQFCVIAHEGLYSRCEVQEGEIFVREGKVLSGLVVVGE